MKKVDIVFAGWLNSPNGASSVVRLLYDYRSLFEENEVRCEFYTNDNYWPLPSYYEPKQLVADRVTLKTRLRKVIKKLICFIPDLELVLQKHNLHRIYMRPGQRIAKKFTSMESPDEKTPVFFHEFFTCYYYLKYTKAKRPILLTLHNNGETFKMISIYHPIINDTWIMRWLKKMERFTFSKVSDFCFVARNPKEVFMTLHPEIDKRKVHYVYNGIPKLTESKDRILENNQSKFELCCVGSVTSRKGQDIIIECIENLTEDARKKVHVTFVGDGNKRKELEVRCRKNGLSSNVTFVGNQKNVNKYLEKADIFILTSRDEGFPMAILEAERMGLPIISTRIAGIPEMIEESKNGFIINPDFKELLPIFKNIDTIDWKGMGEKSKDLYEDNFTLEKMIKNYSSLIKSL